MKPCTLFHPTCYHMVKRRNAAVGLFQVTNHTLRATGIITFLDARGTLDDARRLRA